MVIRVIGIGNEFRGDDAAGVQVVRDLERRNLPGVDLRVMDGEAVDLMEAFEGCEAVVLVDAVQSGEPPGTVLCWESPEALTTAGTLRCSTHVFGLAESLELARALGRLPDGLTVVGIEGETFEPGAPLSDAVSRAIPRAAERVVALLENRPPGPTC